MLRTMGVSDVVSDFISIKRCLGDTYEDGNYSSNSFDGLKRNYIKYVGKSYPDSFIHDNLTESSPYHVVDNPTLASSLMSSYSNDSMLDDLGQENAISGEFDSSLLIVAKKYCNEVEYIAEQSPEFKAVFDLAINYLLVLPSSIASGGSSSALPGVIWINPKTHWDELDRRELLVHELTHNLLFVDELVHGLFEYQGMSDESQWCYSAVLGKSRPLDKAYHSAVVATEILLHREELNQHPNKPHAHPPTKKLISQVLRSIESCESSPLLMDRAKDILKKSKAHLKNVYQ